MRKVIFPHLGQAVVFSYEHGSPLARLIRRECIAGQPRRQGLSSTRAASACAPSHLHH